MDSRSKITGRFLPGSPGKPKGAKNRLADSFFGDLLNHWNEPAQPGHHLTKGQEALETLWKREPAAYARLFASVMPKDFAFSKSPADISDAELDTLINQFRERLVERQKQAIDRRVEPLKVIPNGRGN